MLKMIAEKTRKAELKELREIIKEATGKDYHYVQWYQNVRPALKSGLVKCGYKIVFGVPTSKVEEVNEKLDKWMDKKNPNRIWDHYGKAEHWQGWSTYRIDLIYNYQQA